jgi:hypothetical protein
MSTLGLDPVWGNKSSADLNGLGARLSDVLREVGAIRHEAASKWFGPDFNALAGWYDGPGKRYLTSAIEQIFAASTNLKGNTQDQEQKSTAKSVGVG